MEPNSPQPFEQNKLPRWLTTVTPFSKILAMILFIILPFVGFYLGMKYQQKISVPAVLTIQKIQHKTLTVPTPIPATPSAIPVAKMPVQTYASPTPTPAPTKNSIYISFKNGTGGETNIPGQKCTITSAKTGFNKTVTNSTVFPNVTPADDYILNCAVIAGYNNNTMWTNDNNLWPITSSPYTNRFVVLSDKPAYVAIIYYPKS